MKKRHKVHLLTYEEEDLKDYLLAIHSSLEGFQIAFYLNQISRTKFKRDQDIALDTKKATFPSFKWENYLIDVNTLLFSNKYLLQLEQENTNNNTLFDLPLRNEVSLIPEFKQVDFFIKSNHLETIQLLFKPLNLWSATAMVYEIPSNKIKNRLNLIFD
tara:strand:+ start:422 stop:898 length:477 start_codon:yes stop_codon:yes gene_type:complete